MAAAVPEFAERYSLGSDFLFLPRRHISFLCRDMFLQHGPHAEASPFPHSNHRPRGIRRRPRLDRSCPVRPPSERSSAGHFLVLGESCRLHVPLYLVSWHVPAISL